MSHPDEIVSPIATERPMLTLSSAAINAVPIELDSTPASPHKVREMRRGSRDDLLKEMSPEDQEKRDHWIQERKTDPAVMVDIPQTPGPEELEKSAALAADGSDGALADASAQTQATKA